MPLSKHARAGFEAITKAAGTDLITGALCRGLLSGYERRWGVPDWAVDGVEKLMHTPASAGYHLAGKIDLGFRFTDRGGRRILCDHKTTGGQISDKASHYWEHLDIDTQVSHYMLIALANGQPFSQVLWDVVKRPDIRPRRIGPKEVEALQTNGTYFGLRVRDEAVARTAIALKLESAALLELRMVRDCVEWRPDYYFARGDVFRTEAELAEYSAELTDYMQRLHLAQKRFAETGQLPSRNPGACQMFNRPCPFMALCSGHDSPNSAKWTRKPTTHRELDGVPAELDSFKFVTNSSMSVFRACPRRHHY